METAKQKWVAFDKVAKRVSDSTLSIGEKFSLVNHALS